MSLKDQVDKGVKDVRDSAREAMHRGVADAEKEKREELGDEMTASEKLDSMANEAKNRAQAEIDAGKRSVRDHT
jgi:phosphosulfolactate synthase (CoM biosynthesis protein A)